MLQIGEQLLLAWKLNVMQTEAGKDCNGLAAQIDMLSLEF
jgi:hypothetical protein